MKALLLFTLLVSISASFSFAPVTAVDPYDFFRGFLKSIGDTDDLKELLVCLNNLEPAKETIRQGLRLLFTFEAKNMVEGMNKVREGLLDMSQRILPCIPKYPRLNLLLARIANASPIDIGLKILRNSEEYMALLTKAFECLKVEDLKCVGTNLGDISRSLFLERLGEVSVNMNVNGHMYDFVKGFLRGIGEGGDPTKLLGCITGLDEAVKKIKAALELIKTNNMDKVIQGLEMILDALKLMLRQIKPCMHGLTVLEKLWKAVLNADIARVLGKVLLNLNRVVAEVSFIHSCFREHKYENAGYGVGNLLKFIFLD